MAFRLVHAYPANRVSFDLPRYSSFPTHLGKIEATLLAGSVVHARYSCQSEQQVVQLTTYAA